MIKNIQCFKASIKKILLGTYEFNFYFLVAIYNTFDLEDWF